MNVIARVFVILGSLWSLYKILFFLIANIYLGGQIDHRVQLRVLVWRREVDQQV
jgi:hypothetical protein